MKYDFELDLVNNNSLSIIIEHITKNTVILEFGPANGRLTKYLKEVLGCKVYLVELDETAGKEALQYGEDLVVGDAEDYEWLERYRDISFDYIVFADVLEHLRNPEKVLVEAKHLLKEDGSILLSVPNVAHNSVLIDLCNNKFEYNPIGLLDNTHIHLFTKNSLENMICRAGLCVEERNATYAKVGDCEIVNTANDVHGISSSYWYAREYGEVYQFVYALKKRPEDITVEKNYLPLHSPHYYTQLFLGDKIEENHSVKHFVNDIKLEQICTYTNVEHSSLLRFDPLNAACIIELKEIVATVKGESVKVEVVGSNADIQQGDGYLFMTDDPIINIKVDTKEQLDYLQITTNYLSIDEQQIKQFYKFIDMTELAFLGSKEHILKLQRQIGQLQSEKREQAQQYENKFRECEQQIAEYEKNYRLLEEENKLIQRALESKDNVLEDIYRSKSWKLTSIFRRL